MAQYSKCEDVTHKFDRCRFRFVDELAEYAHTRRFSVVKTRQPGSAHLVSLVLSAKQIVLAIHALANSATHRTIRISEYKLLSGDKWPAS